MKSLTLFPQISFHLPSFLSLYSFSIHFGLFILLSIFSADPLFFPFFTHPAPFSHSPPSLHFCLLLLSVLLSSPSPLNYVMLPLTLLPALLLSSFYPFALLRSLCHPLHSFSQFLVPFPSLAIMEASLPFDFQISFSLARMVMAISFLKTQSHFSSYGSLSFALNYNPWDFAI